MKLMEIEANCDYEVCKKHGFLSLSCNQECIKEEKKKREKVIINLSEISTIDKEDDLWILTMKNECTFAISSTTKDKILTECKEK